MGEGVRARGREQATGNRPVMVRGPITGYWVYSPPLGGLGGGF